jgi:multidrug resistance efflux pump
LTIHAGEWVSPGQALLALTDMARLHVETTDLGERDVPNVSPGQTVSVFVKALNATVPGTVTSIAPEAERLGGDVIYRITLALKESPAGLRPGMSVDVTFGA